MVRLRVFLPLVVWVTLALAQNPAPGPTVFTFAGSLQCGMRMITANQVQTWCFSGAVPNQTLVHNQVDQLAPPSVPSTAFVLVPATVGSVAYLEANGNMTLVTWMVANGWSYQVVATSCTPPPAGTQSSNGCVQQPLVTGQLTPPA